MVLTARWRLEELDANNNGRSAYKLGATPTIQLCIEKVQTQKHFANAAVAKLTFVSFYLSKAVHGTIVPKKAGKSAACLVDAKLFIPKKLT